MVPASDMEQKILSRKRLLQRYLYMHGSTTHHDAYCQEPSLHRRVTEASRIMAHPARHGEGTLREQRGRRAGYRGWPLRTSDCANCSLGDPGSLLARSHRWPFQASGSAERARDCTK
ncbi:unnamed protein product [Symbiodinium natans]|uniref:Uncharacterized protein n=1 Tax=Symbiodinium natans TaxID=878477 RepID=A0A812UBR7_9DINO|nr:unnamed protein product [Symbiodinium natans]